jgi:hypothetical protein
MTPALARLDLTQAAAARLLGIDGRTSRRWAQYGIHGTSEILLRLLLTGRIGELIADETDSGSTAHISHPRRDLESNLRAHRCHVAI